MMGNIDNKLGQRQARINNRKAEKQDGIDGNIKRLVEKMNQEEDLTIGFVEVFPDDPNQT